MLDYLSWMTTSQLVALILGICFSILSVATTFLAFKYAKSLNSFVKACAMTLVVPFFAFVSWIFLILSFLDGFRNNEILNVVISVLIGLFVVGVIIIVAKALYNRNRDKFEADENEDDAIEGTCEDQTNTLEAPEAPVLIANNEQEKTEEVESTEEIEEANIEETPVAEEATEEVAEEAEEENTETEETAEVTEENAETEETAEVTEENAEAEETAEEATEETAEIAEEETTEETAETETTEENNEEVVEEKTEEVVEEKTEEATEETVEEKTEEQKAEEDEKDEIDRFLDEYKEKQKKNK